MSRYEVLVLHPCAETSMPTSRPKTQWTTKLMRQPPTRPPTKKLTFTTDTRPQEKPEATPARGKRRHTLIARGGGVRHRRERVLTKAASRKRTARAPKMPKTKKRKTQDKQSEDGDQPAKQDITTTLKAAPSTAAILGSALVACKIEKSMPAVCSRR